MLQAMLAAMLGGAIGTVFALAMGQFWLVGAFLGGLTGYLSYNVPEIVLAAPKVWRQVCGVRIDMTRIGRLAGWTFLGIGAITQSILFVLLPLAVSAVSVRPTLWQCIASTTMGGIGIALLASAVIAMLCMLVAPNKKEDAQMERELRWLFLYGNPISVCFFMARAIIATASFVPTLVRTVYSELRLVVGLSALQGSVCGWYAHNWLVGAVVAGALFAVQYEVITKRLAKSNA